VTHQLVPAVVVAAAVKVAEAGGQAVELVLELLDLVPQAVA